MQKRIVMCESNLSEIDIQKINRILSNNVQVGLHSVGNFEQFIKDSEDHKPAYLVVDINAASFLKNLVEEKESLLLSMNILCLVNEKNASLSSHALKLKGLVKTFIPMAKTLGLLEYASTISDFLEGKTENAESQIVYLPLDIKIFSSMTESPCDLFIKISEKKYIKVISKGDDSNPGETLRKYEVKGVKEIFIISDDFGAIENIISKNVMEALKTTSVVEKKLKLTESVLGMARDLGVSEYIIEGINESFAEITKDLTSDKTLSTLFNLIGANEGTPIANHSYMTGVLASVICDKVSWGNSNVKKNLCTAAMLHDLDIYDSKNVMYEFKTLEDINKMSDTDKLAFKNHSLNLASRLTKINKIPSDVISFISKHHEGAGKLSYPQGLFGTQLSPPNCLFNIAHQFTIEFARIAFNQNKLDVVFQQLREHYTGNSFKTFIDILEKEIKTM